MKERQPERQLSEDEIDEIVISHADDDDAWEPPTHVRGSRRGKVNDVETLAGEEA
jgi:hypothetical protein